MVLVIGSMMILMTLVLGSLAYTMQSEKLARRDQDYNAAMAAAQSGIEHYISHLNKDDGYHRTVDCANTALKGPTTRSNSCGWTSGTAAGWLPVTPGDASAEAPSFHYAVNGSGVNTNGTVQLTSTGRSRGVYRTIEVAIGKAGSTDFVYYTDFESADPANRVSYPNPNEVTVQCGRNGSTSAKYFWQGRSGCREITFIASDTLDGRTFSNDSFLSSNASFEQGIESANTNCRTVTSATRTWNNCLRPGSTGRFGKQPKYATPLYLADNSAAFAGYPGCHYSGATRVLFHANGTMTVWSKSSNYGGAVLAIPNEAGVTPPCGSGSALASAAGATVPVPHDMVIYANSAPTSGDGAVVREQIDADAIGGPAGSELPLGSYTRAYAATAAAGKSYTYDLNMADPGRYAGEGNLYVEGTVKGRVTLAAAQSVIVTGDVVLAGGMNGDDLVGLVATNSVEVMHPRMVTVGTTGSGRNIRWASPSNEQESDHSSYREGTWPVRYTDPDAGSRVPTRGVQIAGSIQTLQHSFYLQQYDKGSGKGLLLVRGSIAQRWRGAVGTGVETTGYSKGYTYDERLRFTAPPYFPHWVNAEWSHRYSGEISTPAGVKG